MSAGVELRALVEHVRREAVAREREACARMVEAEDYCGREDTIAAAIRARGTK